VKVPIPESASGNGLCSRDQIDIGWALLSGPVKKHSWRGLTVTTLLRYRHQVRLHIVALVALVVLVTGCSHGGKQSIPPPSSTVAPSTTTSTIAGVQTSGTRTVLSPIGLNVRALPSKSARKLGTAAQGVVLSVLGHTVVDGGWYKVKGSTVTGWISGDPTLSAPGEFRAFSSGQFNGLYPATWSASQSSLVSAVFRSGRGPDLIVAMSGPTVAKLPNGRTGYGQIGDSQVVVCGVTSDLLTFQRAASASNRGSATSTPAPYLAQVRIVVDPHHALGFYANLADVHSHLDVFRSFLASVTFASKQCVG
jgi:hypothetical protein